MAPHRRTKPGLASGFWTFLEKEVSFPSNYMPFVLLLAPYYHRAWCQRRPAATLGSGCGHSPGVALGQASPGVDPRSCPATASDSVRSIWPGCSARWLWEVHRAWRQLWQLLRTTPGLPTVVADPRSPTGFSRCCSGPWEVCWALPQQLQTP